MLTSWLGMQAVQALSSLFSLVHRLEITQSLWFFLHFTIMYGKDLTVFVALHQNIQGQPEITTSAPGC